MPQQDGFSPFAQYEGKGPSKRQRFVRWFHNNRLADFGELVDSGDQLLSVGCGTAELESKILAEKFENVYTIEVRRDRVEEAYEKGLASIHGSAPPIPFQNESLDAIVTAGTIEHLPDEQGFLEEARRCLTPEGKLYLTIPIEVGVGGLIRFLAKNFVHPDRNDTPDGFRRYFDYSFAELTKNTPRDKHGTSHRYYNYTNTVEDLRRIFSEVSVSGWPVGPFKQLNLILFVVAKI